MSYTIEALVVIITCGAVLYMVLQQEAVKEREALRSLSVVILMIFMLVGAFILMQGGSEINGSSYGSMYGYKMYDMVRTSAAETYYTVTGNIVVGLIGNNAFSFINSNSLVVNVAGNYLITFSMAINASDHNDWIGGAILDNGIVKGGIASDTGMPSTGLLSPSTVAASGIVYLEAGNVIQFGVKQETTASSTMMIQHATITLVKIS